MRDRLLRWGWPRKLAERTAAQIVKRDFERRLAALSADRRSLLSYLCRVGPLPARELAIASGMPLGLVLSVLPDLKRTGFIAYRAGCWGLSRAAELYAAEGQA